MTSQLRNGSGTSSCGSSNAIIPKQASDKSNWFFDQDTNNAKSPPSPKGINQISPPFVIIHSNTRSPDKHPSHSAGMRTAQASDTLVPKACTIPV